jgi:hypothetical protein
MATVKIIQPRIQEAHFGLYRTSAGGDESIVVRRKIGEPTDYMHLNSRKLQRQRQSFALASQHYAHLSPNQKAISRHQFEEVEYQTSHGKTETKLLMGRQLFIAKDIHELNVNQKQIKPPLEACILLINPQGDPIDGEIWLWYLKNGEWLDCEKERLAPANWLFPDIPPGQEAYQVYGEAAGYFDPRLPEFLAMTEEELKAHHYHQLILPAYQYYHSFQCGMGQFNWYFMFPETATTMFLKSKLRTYDYVGEVTFALHGYDEVTHQRPLIQSHTHYTDPYRDYHDAFLTVFSGVTIPKNKWHFIYITLVDNLARSFRGENWWGYST